MIEQICAVMYCQYSYSMKRNKDSNATKSKSAKKWCQDNDAKLLSVNLDSKTAGFRHDSSAVDVLSFILEEIDAGSVPKNAYLLIDSIENLNRDQLASAVAKVQCILDKGINIVTLRDGKIITPRSSSDVDELMIMVISLFHAYEESKTKSSRASSTWKAKRERVENGKKPKLRSPQWVNYDEEIQEYILNDKSESVEKVFEIYLELGSVNSTARQLNEERVKTIGSSKIWSSSTVNAVLKSKSTYGELDAKSIKEEHFFPAVITKDTFYQAQSLLQRNSNNTGIGRNKGTSNVLTGIATCGVCGAPLYMHGKNRLRASDNQIENYKYLTCSTSRNSQTKCALPNFRYKYVEALIAYICTTVEFSDESSNEDMQKGYIKAKIDSLHVQLKSQKDKINNLATALSEVPSETLIERLKVFEEQKTRTNSAN